MDDGVSVMRLDQVARVERLGVKLIQRCAAHGVSGDEAIAGVLFSTISTSDRPDMIGRIEWLRTLLDNAERQLLDLEKPSWPN